MDLLGSVACCSARLLAGGRVVVGGNVIKGVVDGHIGLHGYIGSWGFTFENLAILKGLLQMFDLLSLNHKGTHPSEDRKET